MENITIGYQAEGWREGGEEFAGLTEMLDGLNTETKPIPRAAKRVHALWVDKKNELLSLLNLALNKNGETLKSFLFMDPEKDAEVDRLFDELEIETDASMQKQIASEIADLAIE